MKSTYINRKVLTRNENVLEFLIHERSYHSNTCSWISLEHKIDMFLIQIKLLQFITRGM